jgi:hypothetical protein
MDITFLRAVENSFVCFMDMYLAQMQIIYEEEAAVAVFRKVIRLLIQNLKSYQKKNRSSRLGYF